MRTEAGLAVLQIEGSLTMGVRVGFCEGAYRQLFALIYQEERDESSDIMVKVLSEPKLSKDGVRELLSWPRATSVKSLTRAVVAIGARVCV